MESLEKNAVRELIQFNDSPCVSIYQPTHRHHPENQQDPIRFKNLLKQVEMSLAQKYRGRETRSLLAPLHSLASDARFWNHTLDSLAVLAAPGTFRVYNLQRPVREFADVAGSFYVKPLLRVIQSADRFQVLCLTRAKASVLEGNRDALDPVESKGFPDTITEALGDELTEAHRAVSRQGSPIHHGSGGRKDEIDKDAERFFRVVDREVAERFSKPSGLPLVLVTLGEHQAMFREISQNSALLSVVVAANPESMSADAIRTAVWKALEPHYLARLASLSDTFNAAQAHNQGTGDLSDAARAAVEGRIRTLLVENARVEPGRINPATGAIEIAALDSPEVGDMLDDLAEIVVRTGGEVIMVPADRMPTKSGLAATYNY